MAKKKCNMIGFGLFVGFVLGLSCATRKGKEFRDDLWEGYRKEGILGKWRVVTHELSGAGQEFINMFDELFRSPEMKTALEKGKTHLEKLQTEGEKKIKEVKKTVANKASEAAKSATTATKKATKKATTKARKTVKKAGNEMKRTVRKIT